MAIVTQSEQEEAFLSAVKKLINEKISELAEQEMQNVFQNIEKKVAKEVDAMALLVLSHYTIERNSREIIIRVSKEFNQ